MKGCVLMGEYMTATIYKPMKKNTFPSDRFNQLCWDLYHAKENKEIIEQIYRSVGFVNPDGSIFNLNMRFIEKEGQMYQTNHGVLGVEQLPNLSLDYKYHFHDFWMSILKPSELTMNGFNYIEAELSGEIIQERYTAMKKENPLTIFSATSVYQHYEQPAQGIPAIDRLIGESDLVKLQVGLIYHSDNSDYRAAAREGITKQRKEIASQITVPHWTKEIVK